MRNKKVCVIRKKTGEKKSVAIDVDKIKSGLNKFIANNEIIPYDSQLIAKLKPKARKYCEEYNLTLKECKDLVFEKDRLLKEVVHRSYGEISSELEEIETKLDLKFTELYKLRKRIKKGIKGNYKKMPMNPKKSHSIISIRTYKNRKK